jgi:hypothetical protein
VELRYGRWRHPTGRVPGWTCAHDTPSQHSQCARRRGVRSPLLPPTWKVIPYVSCLATMGSTPPFSTLISSKYCTACCHVCPLAPYLRVVG